MIRDFLQSLIDKKKPMKEYGHFSDFFLHAPEMKKEEVLTEAAHRSNEEQLGLLRKSRLVESN